MWTAAPARGPAAVSCCSSRAAAQQKVSSFLHRAGAVPRPRRLATTRCVSLLPLARFTPRAGARDCHSW
eukprot:3385162-Alexandrium_andersonii.AAC.1